MKINWLTLISLLIKIKIIFMQLLNKFKLKFCKMEEEYFNKNEWILELKRLNRDYATEFTSRFKPLILFKKEYTSFIDDSTKEMNNLDNKFDKTKINKFKEINEIRGNIIIKFIVLYKSNFF